LLLLMFPLLLLACGLPAAPGCCKRKLASLLFRPPLERRGLLPTLVKLQEP